jgi:hypothetical protein
MSTTDTGDLPNRGISRDRWAGGAVSTAPAIDEPQPDVLILPPAVERELTETDESLGIPGRPLDRRNPSLIGLTGFPVCPPNPSL